MIVRTVMIVLLPMMLMDVDEQSRLPKTTILPADLGAILDPEDHSSAPVPRIPER